jgi:hypothetical protein
LGCEGGKIRREEKRGREGIEKIKEGVEQKVFSVCL